LRKYYNKKIKNKVRVKTLDWKRKEGEKKYAYLYRIYSNQHLIGTNEEVGELCRRELGEDFDESAYRKVYQSFDLIFQDIKEQILDKEYLDELDQKMDEMYKQQVKTRDALREKRKTLRDEARIEVLRDAIKESVALMPSINYVPDEKLKLSPDGNEAILCISDWHVGDKFENFRNTYNISVLNERINLLVEQALHHCKINNVTHLVVANLGDMIAGNIHGSIRVQSELDTIEQTKKAAFWILQVLIRLSEKIKKVTYRSCLDNHSRVNKDYSEHIERESFAKFIDWWLELALEKEKAEAQKKGKKLDVSFMQDNLDDNIGYFKCAGKNIFFVHGHLDQVNSVLQNLTFGTGIIADSVLMGHWHSDKMKNFQGRKVYLNGSLKGTDEYAKDKRLFGDASQTLLVFHDKSISNICINLQ